MLWDWFVDMRSSFATAVSPRFVLAKAKHVAKECLEEMEATIIFVQMPVLDSAWLRRWKARYDVVWRKPNAKYKISFGKL